MFIKNKGGIVVEKIFAEMTEMVEDLYAEADEIVNKYKKGE